jgi:hypothetical protein
MEQQKTNNTFKLLPQVFFKNTLFSNELHVLLNQMSSLVKKLSRVFSLVPSLLKQTSLVQFLE